MSGAPGRRHNRAVHHESELPSPPDTVVLLHGLWMSGWAMVRQRGWLADCGYRVDTFRYATVRRALDDNARALAAHVRALPARRLHLVGHSLGGLVILRMLALAPDARIGRAVLLGSPVRGSGVARTLQRVRLGRAILGHSLPAWDDAIHALPRWPCAVGMIAGRIAFGAGLILKSDLGPNDGTVAVAETELPSFDDHLVLPVSHTGMLLSRRVAFATCRFLAQGRFPGGGEA